MTLDPKTQALIWRALLGIFLVEVPVLTIELSKPSPDWKLLALGLLGGAAAWLEKNYSPQLSSPGAEVAPVAPPKP